MHLPVSTYRLQLHCGFTFRETADIIPYLSRLGITDCYVSPCLMAHPGSTHGYDICDHNKLNPELGGEDGFELLINELRSHGMGLILDFVPNHMEADHDANAWWKDVLENGPSSPYAGFFDIDWNPIKKELKGKALLPVLGDHYGKVLEKGELQLGFGEGALYIKYYEHKLPVNPRQAPIVYKRNIENLQSTTSPDDPEVREFLSIITSLNNLPVYTETQTERIVERQREKEVARERLAKLAQTSNLIRNHIEENVRFFNGINGQPQSFDSLHNLLEAQAYRLAFWRTAGHEINYRRFFDINNLVGLRMEDSRVFSATHQLVLKLICEDKIHGLRLDHIDGLFDPKDYLQKLQQAISEKLPCSMPPANGMLFYVIVEKILTGKEKLPDGWAVCGTTGYDFANDLNRIFVDSRHVQKMKAIYEEFTERRTPFNIDLYVGKKLIMSTSMASELNVLAQDLNRISESDRRCRDFTLESLHDALREITACFPVYRTYVASSGWTVMDKEAIEKAIAAARKRNPAMETSIFDFIRDILLPPEQFPETAKEYKRRLNFAMKFQQYTGPVQAKGLEDTAFYRHNILISLNEVGGDPRTFGAPVSAFHEANICRLNKWPYGMITTSTHDSKRGEDARARINVLSELPDVWRRNVYKWSRINNSNRTELNGETAPARNDEYLFYQALIGSWPAEPETISYRAALPEFAGRIRNYMLKAVREAKIHTSWINPNADYENAVTGFVEKTLTGPKSKKFLSMFLPFERMIARLGMVNSLSQITLKMASPGVTDFYQGAELWDLNLVDPDNRRPIDYEKRIKTFEEMLPLSKGTLTAAEKSKLTPELLKEWHDGRIKLYITALGLHARRQWPDLFLKGDYIPLTVSKDKEEHVVALVRRHEGKILIALAPRFVASLAGSRTALPIGSSVWGKSKCLLPDQLKITTCANMFTGEQIQTIMTGNSAGFYLAEVFNICPVAWLWAE